MIVSKIVVSFRERGVSVVFIFILRKNNNNIIIIIIINENITINHM